MWWWLWSLSMYILSHKFEVAVTKLIHKMQSQVFSQHCQVAETKSITGQSLIPFDASDEGDVMTKKHFLYFWPFVRWIHQSPVNSPYNESWMWSFDILFMLNLYAQNYKNLIWCSFSLKIYFISDTKIINDIYLMQTHSKMVLMRAKLFPYLI